MTSDRQQLVHLITSIHQEYSHPSPVLLLMQAIIPGLDTASTGRLALPTANLSCLLSQRVLLRVGKEGVEH